MNWNRTLPIRLINLGVKADFKESRNFRIRLVNWGALFSIVATLAYLPTYFGIENNLLLGAALLNIAVYAVPLILNDRGHPRAARTLLVITATINLTIFACIYGKDSGYQYFFLALEAAILVLFDHTEKRLTAFSLLGLLLATLWLLFFGYDAFPPLQLETGVSDFLRESFHYITFFSISATVLLLSWSHRKIERDLDRTLSQVLRERDTNASLIANAPALIFVTDQNGTLLSFNHACEQSSGLSEPEALGRSIPDLFTDLPLPPPLETNSRPPPKKSCTLKRPDGTVRHLALSSVPIRHSATGEQNLLWLGEDITEALRSAAILKSQEQELEASGRFAAIGEVAASIAHEINNPLSILRLQNERITQYLKEGAAPPPLQHAAWRVDAMSLRITRIVRSLQSLTRNSSADPFVRVSLEQLLRDALDFVEDRYRTAGFELRLAPQNLTTEIECRPIQISQVILNLLTNAWDSIRERTQLEADCPRQVEIRCDTRTDQGRDWVHIQIMDTGQGLSPEAAAKIGKSVFTTKPPGRGTGIGLKLSHTILETHSGRLALALAPEEGKTKFTLILPIQQPKTTA
jgi:PAS domain S-box-containing protein